VSARQSPHRLLRASAGQRSRRGASRGLGGAAALQQPPIWAAAAAAVGVVLAAFAGEPTAWAYDFSLTLNTVAQGYQERRYSSGGAAEMLSRRRLTQYLNLSVFGMEPDRWTGPDQDRNQLSFQIGLRFDSDFGTYLTGQPQAPDAIAELPQNQMDVLFAYILARNLHGVADVQLGRQLHYDRVDFYSFDGADVRVRLSHLVQARGFAGTEVRGEQPLSAPIYESDGTSAGSRDPATRPEQASAWRPMVGAGLDIDGASAPIPFSIESTYRRTFSETEARRPGDPPWGVNHESLSATLDAAWAGRVFLDAGIRYNLLVGFFDDQQVALRWRLGSGHFVTLEYSYLAPTFDGDSIWNVFAAGAYRDWRAGYDLRLSDEWRLHARGFLRTFVDSSWESPAEAALSAAVPGGRRSYGGNVGTEGRSARARLRFDLYADAGFGGWKAGGDLSGRWSVDPRRFDLEGRVTIYGWRDDDVPEPQTALMAGLGLGGIYKMSPKIRLHLLGEDNRGTYYSSQLRALAILEVDVSL
jgi:hypothetical protein